MQVKACFIILVSLVLSAPAQAAPLKQAGLKSGIWIGAAMDSHMPEDQRQDLQNHFTALTSENAFKWSSMESVKGQIDFSATDQMVSFAAANHLRFRAHTLFWHRMQNPTWLRAEIQSASDPRIKLYEIMDDHIDQVVSRYKGKIDVWDVVNEPLRLDGQGWDLQDGVTGSANFLYLAAGEEYIDRAFHKTRQADPRAKLFLNEYVSRPALNDAKSQALLQLLKRLKARKVPIDGVGIQLHGIGSVRAPFFSSNTTELVLYMQALAKLGLRVEITELDISLPAVVKDLGLPGMNSSQHLQLQANVYERVVRACALVSACSGVTVWGLRDKDSWLNSFIAGGPHRPLLLADDGSTKPAYDSTSRALLARCKNQNIKLCSEPWPNPQNAGLPLVGVRCPGCIKLRLRGRVLTADPKAWRWQRQPSVYRFRWLQSRPKQNRGYSLVPRSQNKPSLRVGRGQRGRWARVCVAAKNSYGWSEWSCSASRGPFR